MSYSEIFTKEFLEKNKRLSSYKLGKLHDCDPGTIRYYRRKFNIDYEPELQIISPVMKVKKDKLSFQTLHDLSKLLKETKRVTESKQRSIVYEMESDLWTLFAVFGDIHFGNPRIDLDLLLYHTELILMTPNAFGIQIGDILHNEGAKSHRSMNRPAPFELPLDIQRTAAKMWFKKIGPKLLAFIIGNHDERLINDSDYDIGEELVQYITGGYLGYNGTLTIKFSNVEYNIYLDHYGRGKSNHNPLYPGILIHRSRPYLDAVLFGHLHAGAAIIDIPTFDDSRFISIRSSGYEDPELDYYNPGIKNNYGWKVGDSWNIPKTPCFLLNPKTKEIIPFISIEDGIEMLRIKNGVVNTD